MLKFILIVLSLFFYTQIQGQGEFPLINKYATWLIISGTGPDASYLDEPTYTTTRFTQDTIIASKKYTKYNTRFVREEGDKVFALCEGEEVLLYDYSMKVGDSIYIKHFCEEEYKFKVSRIDSIEINGQYRKRIHFNTDDDGGALSWWIEGIGSNIGPIYDYVVHQFEVNINLATYKTPDFIFDIYEDTIKVNEEYCIGTKSYYSGQDDKVELYEVIRDTFIDFRQTHIIEHKTIENSNTTITNSNIYLSKDFSITYLWEDNSFIPMFDFTVPLLNSYSFKRNNTIFNITVKELIIPSKDGQFYGEKWEVSFIDANGKSQKKNIEIYPKIGLFNSFLIDENIQSYDKFDKHYGVRCYDDCNLSFKSRAWESSTSSCDIYLSNDNIIKKNEALSLYPNPVSNTFSIPNYITNSARIKIYDITGTQIYFKRDNNQIDISNCPKGIYFLSIQTENKLHNLKFIKN